MHVFFLVWTFKFESGEAVAERFKRLQVVNYTCALSDWKVFWLDVLSYWKVLWLDVLYLTSCEQGGSK